MQVTIIGCGRVGEALARYLVEAGEEVVVMDKDPNKLDRISELDCLRVDGMVIDRDTMKDAGMGNADVLCCVTDDENLNLMAGQIAREFFNVPLVIVRVYNSSHIDVFGEENFKIICTTQNTLDDLLSCFVEEPEPNTIEIEGNLIAFSRLEMESDWVNQTILEIEPLVEGHILGVVRAGQLLLAQAEMRLQLEDDLVLVNREE